MRIAQHSTAISAHRAHVGSGKAQQQCGRILAFITQRGGDWSIGELAKALGMEKSTISARLRSMLHESCELVEKPRRRDRVSGITVRPVGLPAGQAELFPMNGVAIREIEEGGRSISPRLKHELFNDHFQNSKRYSIKKAQLIIADIPYNVGKNAYGSSPEWYVNGDNKNGESKLANSEFFDTDKDFRIPEFLHFCSKMMIAEPKETGKAPCMIVFCAFDQQFELIEEAKKHGLNNYINLVFVKNSSAQVLKANMRVVGNCEYGLILYRDKLPKFNNRGKMIFNAMPWEKDNKSEKIHPTQKPVRLLENLISIFTDPGDVVIDPCAGSASTIIAAIRAGRSAYGWEIKKDFFRLASNRIKNELAQADLFRTPSHAVPQQVEMLWPSTADS